MTKRRQLLPPPYISPTFSRISRDKFFAILSATQHKLFRQCFLLSPCKKISVPSRVLKTYNIWIRNISIDIPHFSYERYIAFLCNNLLRKEVLMTPTQGLFQTQQTIRLVATDLDGTLLRPDGTVSSRTHEALQRVQDAGMTVVLVSARPPRILREIARALDISGLAICCNGALVYDLDGDTIVQHWPLSATLARRLITILRNTFSNLMFACECGLEFACEPDFHRLSLIMEKKAVYIDDALSFCNQPLTKLLALHSTYEVEDFHRHVSSLLGEEVIVTHSGASFLEISAAGVTKARALATLCEERGITPDEVVAFGDMPNDLSMLNWAGYGVAVANAHPLVRASADAITRSNSEDGVAVALEELLNQ
jgi:Cof subfamily protein (haloacid dehalogenase superfamily)